MISFPSLAPIRIICALGKSISRVSSIRLVKFSLSVNSFKTLSGYFGCSSALGKPSGAGFLGFMTVII
jgi:hypothetical protein